MKHSEEDLVESASCWRLSVCFRDSGDDIELASCALVQPPKDFTLVSSCSCELLCDGMPWCHVCSAWIYNTAQRCSVIRPDRSCYTDSICLMSSLCFSCVLLSSGGVVFMFWMCCSGSHRGSERLCSVAVDQLTAAYCQELPITQHPSHVPLERFLQSPEAQNTDTPASGTGPTSWVHWTVIWFSDSLSLVKIHSDDASQRIL